METIFDSIGKKVYHTNGHTGYLIKWNLLMPFCRKWSRNREPDMERVEEMCKHLSDGGHIPQMIHLAEIIDEGIVCYDGNHRREVFNLLNDKEFVCIVDVMFSATQNDVYKAFNAINKAVQLPAIYIDEQNNNDNVKTEILQLVKKYETKYKPFLSTSSRCHAPQFNRDNFIDNIYNIYMSFDRTVSIKQLNELFEKLNIEYQHEKICRPHSLYKKSLIDKCKKHNFWLFIDKTISFEHVEFLLKHNVEK